MEERNYTTDAINLKSYDLSDADKIILMYSRDKGLIRGVAKGVKKPKSKLGARMDSLIANTLMFAKGKSLDRICQAQSINTFNESRHDIDKLMCSSYISEVVSNFGVEEDPCSKEVYDLLYKALDKISHSKTKKDVLIAVIKFQLKMMLISGFSLELDSCLCCGERVLNKDMYFSQDMGGIICEECNQTFKIKTKMHYKIRDFLEAMLQFDFDYTCDYDQKANEKVCTVCFNLLKNYIQSHSSKKFKSDKILQEIL